MLLILAIVFWSYGISEVISGIFYPNIDSTLGYPYIMRGIASIGIGLFFLYIYRANKKKANEEATRKAEEEERRKQEEAERVRQREEAQRRRKEQLAEIRARSEYITVKIAGVTFKNEDGSSRQKVLKRLMDEDYTGDMFLTIEPCDYHGELTYSILYDGYQIGSVPKTDIKKIESIYDRIDDISIDIDSFENDEDKTIYYGTITVRYPKDEE